MLTRFITATGGAEWNEGGAKVDDGWNDGGNATGGDEIADAGRVHEAINGTATNGGDFTCRRLEIVAFLTCSSPVLTAMIVAANLAIWLVSVHQLPKDRVTMANVSTVVRKGELTFTPYFDLPS